MYLLLAGILYFDIWLYCTLVSSQNSDYRAKCMSTLVFLEFLNQYEVSLSSSSHFLIDDTWEWTKMVRTLEPKKEMVNFYIVLYKRNYFPCAKPKETA